MHEYFANANANETEKKKDIASKQQQREDGVGSRSPWCPARVSNENSSDQNQLHRNVVRNWEAETYRCEQPDIEAAICPNPKRQMLKSNRTTDGFA